MQRALLVALVVIGPAVKRFVVPGSRICLEGIEDGGGGSLPPQTFQPAG